MKQFQIYGFLMLGLLLGVWPLTSQAQDWTKYGWTDAEIKQCHTASEASYLSKAEREVIMLMNLARVYPQKFVKNMQAMLKAESKNDQFGFASQDFQSSYYKSLVADLNKTTAMSPLLPLKELHQASLLHAKDMGKSGDIGHTGTNGSEMPERVEMYYKGDYRRMGENCAYGSDAPIDIVMDLLIDEDVPSLGHRKAILSKDFSHVGVSIQPHKVYRNNTVMNFLGGIE
ncbi:CAP domain-containing protein [Eisenibacter elegans]|uniref:CAP domain-containing protein n=1 Tax=Eisenibacter elegans TaxID=997 RepID=UPI00042A6E63|nr:CAP domain-containing protein [Eisenibacter elegans]